MIKQMVFCEWRLRTVHLWCKCTFNSCTILTICVEFMRILFHCDERNDSIWNYMVDFKYSHSGKMVEDQQEIFYFSRIDNNISKNSDSRIKWLKIIAIHLYSITATIQVSHICEKEEKRRSTKIWTNAIKRSILKVLRNKNQFFLHYSKKSLFFFAFKLLKAENDNNGLQIKCNNAINSRWNV